MPRHEEDSAHGGKAPNRANASFKGAKDELSTHGSVASYHGTDVERDTSREFKVGWSACVWGCTMRRRAVRRADLGCMLLGGRVR